MRRESLGRACHEQRVSGGRRQRLAEKVGRVRPQGEGEGARERGCVSETRSDVGSTGARSRLRQPTERGQAAQTARCV